MAEFEKEITSYIANVDDLPGVNYNEAELIVHVLAPVREQSEDMFHWFITMLSMWRGFGFTEEQRCALFSAVSHLMYTYVSSDMMMKEVEEYLGEQ